MSSAKKASELIKYAEHHPKGFTRKQAQNDLDFDWSDFGGALHRARIMLGASGDDRVFLCEPNGQEPWVYRLTRDFDQAQPYARMRVHDTQSRLKTIEATAMCMVNATVGGTLEGRKARKIMRTVKFLNGELDELDAAVN